MDDILASIRRIIADDDAIPLSRRPVALPAAVSRSPSPAASMETPRLAASSPTVDAFAGLGLRLRKLPEAPQAESSPPPTAPATQGATPQPAEPKRAAASAAEPTLKTPLLNLRDFAQKPAAPAAVVSPTPSAVSPAPAPAPVPAPAPIPAPVAAPAPAASISAPSVTPRPSSPFLGGLRPSLAEVDKPVEAPPMASVVTLNIPAPAFAAKAPTPIFRAAIAPAPAPAPAAKSSADQPALVPAPVPVELAKLEPTKFDWEKARTEKPVSVAVAAPQIAAPAPPLAPLARPEPPKQVVSEPKPQPRDSEEAALLSPASDAKIGAAFGALSDTLLSRDPDMVERLAREMLRPMLKNWLDDNLPIVVERLVRAEIERVARGRSS